MGLRDLLKKKDDLQNSEAAAPQTIGHLATPEFTFIRSDTHTQERIYPPTGPANTDDELLSAKEGSSSKPRRSRDVFKSRSRGSSVSSLSDGGDGGSPSTKKEKKKDTDLSRSLSQRLHLHRAPLSSENVPQHLPQINVSTAGADTHDVESQWENRATILAVDNEKRRSRSPSAAASQVPELPQLRLSDRPMSPNEGVVSSKEIDADIQEAIRLHEEGQLEPSTKLFGKLADPNGANNPLSQVLYGLALRHGWGCTPDPARAVEFLSAAASNAATVEEMALKAGVKKGGAAKGELVLAIFELANCFRNGWGIEKDPVAAKQYFETAANLGDTDAMNEVAYCYLEGVGCKKDKFLSAKYYRLAEKNGNKTLGNSWIWKEKYDPPEDGGTGGKKKEEVIENTRVSRQCR